MRKYCRGMVWRAALSASSFLSSFGLVSGSCVVCLFFFGFFLVFLVFFGF